MAFSFSFDGVRSEYRSIIINKITRSIAPPINTRSATVPNRDGIYFYRNDLSSKTIDVDITVKDASQNDLRKTIEEIANYLDPKGGVQELIFDDETDRIYYAVLSNDTDFDQLLSFGKTTLIFLIPDGVSHSLTSTTQNISMEAPAIFIRASSAYTRNLTGLGFIKEGTSDPRYSTCVYNKGIYIEEGTANMFSIVTSQAGGTSEFTAVGTGTTVEAIRAYAIISSLTLRIRSQGLAAGEGTSISSYAIVASNNYTFSIYLRGRGTIKLQSLENDGGATTHDSANLTLNWNAYQRLTLSFTATGATTGVILKVLTTTQESAEIVMDALQLEHKLYSTSWMQGTKTRAEEFLKIVTTNKLNGQQGTIDFFFKKTGTPTPYGGMFDWGADSTGPTIDRIGIFHGTAIGSGEDVIRLEVSNTGKQQKILNLDIGTNLVVGRPYYLAARWNLSGSTTGNVSLALIDLENNTSYQTNSATTINPPQFTAYSTAYVGSVRASSFKSNCIYEDFRLSAIERNDTDIDDSWNSRKPLLKDTDSTVKYTWNETLYGTLISNEGSANGYPLITFHQVLASTYINLDIYPTTSRFEYLTTDGSFYNTFQINTSGAYANNFFGASTNNINSVLTVQSRFPVLTGDHYFLSNDTAAILTLEYTPRWL